jgi:hypothetical protein
MARASNRKTEVGEGKQMRSRCMGGGTVWNSGRRGFIEDTNLLDKCSASLAAMV